MAAPRALHDVAERPQPLAQLLVDLDVHFLVCHADARHELDEEVDLVFYEWVLLEDLLLLLLFLCTFKNIDPFGQRFLDIIEVVRNHIVCKTVSNPQNRIYDTSSVELDFTVSEAASEILYCLDGKENQTITGNMTLTGLENGTHNVTFYASDLAGNDANPKTLHFTVAAFPIVPVVAAITTATLSCGLGLLIYFKKPKVGSGDKT